MNVPSKFKEYIWLVNTIRRHRKISLAEINERWVRTEMSGGVEFARATFARHRNAIEDMFGIIIDCDTRDGNKYYIENERVFRENSVQNWLLSTLTVHNIVSESLSLQDRIMLEPATCDDYLPVVVEAMKRKVRVAVTYHRYGQDKPSYLNFEPYCVRLFRQRWYVLGHFHSDPTEDYEGSDYFGMFSFDRIEDMQLTDIKFEIDPEFDAKEYFDECYGVIAGDGTEPQRIILRAYGMERYYMRDLPIHHSQREIKAGKDYADFQFYMRPTMDLKGHILNRGAMLKVLKPKELADDIRQMLLDSLMRYE